MNHLLSPSELILNPDGSVYHLNILPEHLAETVVLVGDPDRADLIRNYFDKNEFSRKKREFVTHTGYIGKKRISVVSTGIGTDNIDIVLSELDILASIDLARREILETPRQLSLVRLGTSGGLSAELEAGQLIVSAFAVGMDNLMSFYKYDASTKEQRGAEHIMENLKKAGIDLPFKPYLAAKSWDLQHDMKEGITVTCPGFYGPQGRNLKNRAAFPDILKAYSQLPVFESCRISNLEMETAGIYALASVLGHKAISVSVILANRFNGSFSSKPSADIKNMIEKVLPLISE